MISGKNNNNLKQVWDCFRWLSVFSSCYRHNLDGNSDILGSDILPRWSSKSQGQMIWGDSPCYSGCWHSRGKDSFLHRSWPCNLWARGSISSWGRAWSRCKASAGSSPGRSHWDTTHTQKQFSTHHSFQGVVHRCVMGKWQRGHLLENRPSQGNAWARPPEL